MLSRRRFDVDEVQQMTRAGILHEDDHVVLLDGELVQMPAVGSRHISCVARLTRLLVSALVERALVTVQSPVRLNRYSEPEPDLALLRPRDDDYAGATPAAADVLLLIEVADTTLRIDRRVKLPHYAAAGIPEVWIVDLTADAVEMHQRPAGRAYEVCRRVADADGSVAPAAFPDLELAIEAILPPAGAR